jgi:glutamate synthase (NADPH/NADH) large chain
VGFVAHIRGERSREIVVQALEVLRRMSHRGACGCDPRTGDGAGILINFPHRFFKREGLRLGLEMPRRRRYGVGQVFLPPDPAERASCERLIEEAAVEQGQRVLGWRDVPVDSAHVGSAAASVMPVFRQIYIGLRRLPPTAFERKLFVIRKLASNRIRSLGVGEGYFHIASLSTETIVYKGLLLPEQLPLFYRDLEEPDMVSGVALVHSRFSTNTLPTWDLAQPFRYIAHNGEINTLRGNRNWLAARRSQLTSAKFDGPLDRLFPIIEPGGSDSAQFDNMLELLRLGGRTLSHSLMMMIPEAWENAPDMSSQLRDFYQYFSALLEPWDGPAAIVFTSGGRDVGATLDRNGLRPARYWITTDDRVILASEAGVLDVPPEQVRAKGRLRAGKMFIVDTEEGRILDDVEVKRDKAGRFPYGRWLKKNIFDIDSIPDAEPPPAVSGDELVRLQRSFGYTDEDLRLIVGPMAETGEEPVSSMGVDTPIAVLSDQAPTLYNYFHQLFAQVTNPPIDPIREALVMTLKTFIGPEGNTFDETPEQCHQLELPGPILTSRALARIKGLHEGVFEPTVLGLLHDVADGPTGLGRAVESLCARAVEAVDEGFNLLVLSDRGVDTRRVAIPALLAVSAVHQHLVREGIRMQAGLVVETAEAREVHDFAALIGFGAAAVNPYLALDTVEDLVRREIIAGPAHEASRRYVAAVENGLLKIMAKMGISTIFSYRGAQIFEAVGLDRALVDRHFAGTPSRIEGIGLEELGRETLERHRRGLDGELAEEPQLLPLGGQHSWRRQGEQHRWNPATIAKLQAAVRRDDPALFREFAALLEEEELRTLRGMLELDLDGGRPVALEEVEPASEIARRFVTSAMSFGSISAEAHETLAIAMNRLGSRSNSGEGGEEAHRYLPDEGGELRRSATKQVASGRFGVTTHYLVSADELQIKIAQGAKPGEGGQLPGHKVDERIARVRHATPGVMLISPPPHHDIYSIEDLAQLIYDLHAVNPAARISVKLVSEFGVGTVAAGVAKAHAGCVVISGYDGGTGASPLSSIRHAGLPWELGIAEAQQVLVQNRLRDRVRLQVDGGLRGPRDVVVAALLGAEEFGFGTAALVALGCVLERKCHRNACSVGIGTQDPELRRCFTGRPEHVASFFLLLAEEVRRQMAELGYTRFEDMVGQVERLRPRQGVRHWKARRVDLSMLLAVPPPGPRRHLANRPWPLGRAIGASRQLPPRGGRAAQRRARPSPRRPRAVARRDHRPARGGRRSEPRCLSGAGDLARAPRGGQRLRRQGDVRRADRDRPAAGEPLCPRGQRDRRQHRPLRRHRGRALRLRRGRRALRRAQQRRPRGGGERRRPLLRVHDRRGGDRARQDGTQLRRRDERRDRVRLRPRQQLPALRQHRDRGDRGAGGRERHLARAQPDRGPRPLHRQRPRPAHRRQLGAPDPQLRQGDPSRVPAGAREAEGREAPAARAAAGARGAEGLMDRRPGFLVHEREHPAPRPVAERLRDHREVHLPAGEALTQRQARRCMDCGVPFCHQGCPLGNQIPDLNRLVRAGRWREAYARLSETSSFPELTARLCPAPCEAACVLAINRSAVTIAQIEREIVERAFAEGWVVPRRPRASSDRRVAIVGSGPAGLAAASQLARAGHQVAVYEASDRIGGLLRYGVPDFKLEKRVLDRRLEILRAEGIELVTGTAVGVDLDWASLREAHDAVLIAIGAGRPRELDVPGRELDGVHLALDYLVQQNGRVAGLTRGEVPTIDAAGRRVIILGGGDTGADCLGVALRQGAASVRQIELLPRPPSRRPEHNPWPEWPLVYRSSSSHDEGGEREFALLTKRLAGREGRLTALHAVRVEFGSSRRGRRCGKTEFVGGRLRELPGSELELAVDLLILALGFEGPQDARLSQQLGVELDHRNAGFATNVDGVFVAGDARRGASLVVWALHEGREAARAIDRYLAQARARQRRPAGATENAR